MVNNYSSNTETVFVSTNSNIAMIVKDLYFAFLAFSTINAFNILSHSVANKVTFQK